MNRRIGLRSGLLLALLASGARADEQLNLPTGEDWQQVSTLATPSLRRAVFAIPVSEEIVDTLSLEWFATTLATDLDPIEVAALLADGLREGCEDGSDQPVFSGYENGYPTTVRLMTCPRTRGRETGELMMVKVVQGRAGHWTVVRSRQLPAFTGDARAPVEEEVVARWSLAMRSIQLCDTEAPDAHPCPEAPSEATP
ncbi:MAG: hypothetical protein V2I63_09040 [Pseudomonadales bacterium]|jgi:hypothetical protein|nr:hypothetical protein [Pseudomonadales bacterium]